MEAEEFDIYAQKGMKQLENVVDKRSILEDFINSSGQNSFFFYQRQKLSLYPLKALSEQFPNRVIGCLNTSGFFQN